MMPPLSIQIGRSVGFVSAVVGMLCYALSSSFHHLFGDWNFLKIFLYFIVTFTICCITLFAKKPRQRLLSPRFKTHMQFLVFIATNVYSFFYDKVVNEKPDVYILLSCVAFAVLWLSLSTRTQCGFEPDLANYFLGCLILLLMKINLWSTFVGIGVSYSVVIVIFPNHLDATQEREYSGDGDYMALPMDLLEALTNGGIQVNPTHINCDSVIQIDSLLIMTQFKACIGALQRKDEIMLHELCTYVNKYLEVYAFYIRHNGIRQLRTDDNLLMDSLPSETINSLHETVKHMMDAGFEEECCHLYSQCRSRFLQNFFLRLQLSDFNSKGSNTSSIQKWMKACLIALRILFPWERRLCHRVFSGFSSAADLSFMKVCRELTNDLLNFPNNLTFESESLSLNYVEKNVKVYKTLRNLIPMFELVFYDDCSVSLKNEAIMALGRLGEGNMLFFMKFCRELTNDLLYFPNDLTVKSLTLKSVEMFQTLNDLKFGTIFFDYCSVSLKNEAITSLGRLDEAFRLLSEKLERSREKNRLFSQELNIQTFRRNLRVELALAGNYSLREQKTLGEEKRLIGKGFIEAITENLKIEVRRLVEDEIKKLASTYPSRTIQPNLEAESEKINPAAGCRYHPTKVAAGQHCRYAFRRPLPSGIGRRFRSSGHRR